MEKKSNIYILKGTINKMDQIIHFKKYEFHISELDAYYMKEGKNSGCFEVLPGIYYEKFQLLKKGVTPGTPSTHDSIYQMLKSLFKLLYHALYVIQPVKIVIENRNSRDYFSISGSAPVNENSEYYESDLETVHDSVNPKDLPYPETLGGGASRCVIWDIFQSIGLFSFDTSNTFYHDMSLSHLLEITSYSKELLNLCERSAHCGCVIKKMKEGTYLAKYKGGCGSDDISVDYYVASKTYSLGEGKHRVCMAKRFNIETIPVVLTKVTPKGSAPKRHDVRPYFSHLNRASCSDIMEACYRVYKDIGLDKDAVHELLERGITNKDYIHFIEEKAGKSIIDICSDVINRKNNDIY